MALITRKFPLENESDYHEKQILENFRNSGVFHFALLDDGEFTRMDFSEYIHVKVNYL